MSSTFLVLPAETVENIRNQVDSDADLTSLPVAVALMPENTTPDSADWIGATWDPGNITRWLYPGDRDIGTYDYWVRITASPEIPMRNTGIIVLTG